MPKIVVIGLIVVITLCGLYYWTTFGPTTKEEIYPSKFLRKTIDSEESNSRIIVFVNGVGGNIKDTWTNKDEDTVFYWPKAIKEDPDFLDYDIFVLSYYTSKLRLSPTIFELSKKLSSELKSNNILRSAGQNYREIIFITHSMGNLVLRTAIKNNKQFKEITDRLILAIAAPFNGSDSAHIAEVVSFNPQYGDMVKSGRNSFVQDLNFNWKKHHKDTEIACAYEKLNTSFAGKIVESGSATAMCTRIPPEVFVENHTSIVKPKSKESSIYKWVKNEIFENRHCKIGSKKSGSLNDAEKKLDGIIVQLDKTLDSKKNNDFIYKKIQEHINDLIEVEKDKGLFFWLRSHAKINLYSNLALGYLVSSDLEDKNRDLRLKYANRGLEYLTTAEKIKSRIEELIKKDFVCFHEVKEIIKGEKDNLLNYYKAGLLSIKAQEEDGTSTDEALKVYNELPDFYKKKHPTAPIKWLQSQKGELKK